MGKITVKMKRMLIDKVVHKVILYVQLCKKHVVFPAVNKICLYFHDFSVFRYISPVTSIHPLS